ncbi:MAG: DUF4163 domain-containing protein [Flavobacteriaceae bacterium]|nr:DUF3298 and DUF4163 domain-containing protein [Bacteroidia bacterium]MBT8288884.1 DUF3298 and DUF4163 domain-containing protein [Bacteroidia bacterium]NNF74067.1 DUF4163 domain-containing protein [Flavobacteriaceae bacterium]NNK73575.1 DUF4163 domain-containing protein [Flavobacteriaceae bacterium]
MRSFLSLFAFTFLFFSCEEEALVAFSERIEIYDENAIIEINIPKAEGDSELSRSINETLENHIANMLNFGEENLDSVSLDEAIRMFDSEYNQFKSDMEESGLTWEAIFDAEVIYQSHEVICLAINGYMNTGGAHGNMNITFYNFEGETGRILQIDDILTDKEAFTEFVKPYFEKAIESKEGEKLSDYFFGDPFHLPANIGINEDGILMLYNVYEIGSYAQGITEFTIPFEEVEAYLKLK